MPATRRRTLALAAGAAAASLSGCLGTSMCVDVSGPNVRTAHGLRLRTTSDEAVVETADRSPADLHPLGRELVRAAVAEDGVTYHGAYWKPSLSRVGFPSYFAPDNSFVRVDGGYRRVQFEKVAEEETTGQRVRASTDAQVNADAQSADPVRVADLPTHDHWLVLARLGSFAGKSQSDVDEFASLWGLGYLETDLVESSSLVPEPEHRYLRHEDWFVRLEPLGSTTMTLRNYAVRVDPVDGSTGEVAATIRRTDGTALESGDLTDAQRDLVETAIDGAYRSCGETSGALQGLHERLRGDRYVEYEGTWYAIDWLPDATGPVSSG